MGFPMMICIADRGGPSCKAYIVPASKAPSQKDLNAKILASLGKKEFFFLYSAGEVRQCPGAKPFVRDAHSKKHGIKILDTIRCDESFYNDLEAADISHLNLPANHVHSMKVVIVYVSDLPFA